MKQSLRKQKLIKYGDVAGMAASVLCLVHCIAMPLAIFVFPVLGLAHAHDHGHDHVHEFLVLAITLPVLLALVPGYLRHRDRLTLAIGGAGLAVFLLAVFVAGPLFGHATEAMLAIASGFMLLYAHLRNRRHCQRCSAQQDADDAASCCTR